MDLDCFQNVLEKFTPSIVGIPVDGLVLLCNGELMWVIHIISLCSVSSLEVLTEHGLPQTEGAILN